MTVDDRNDPVGAGQPGKAVAAIDADLTMNDMTGFSRLPEHNHT